MKILVLSSLAWSLVNFRGQLLQSLVAEGHEVIACAPDDDEQVRGELVRMGIELRIVPLARASVSPVRDSVTMATYLRLLNVEKPDVVIAYTQKPIILGGLANRIFGKARFFIIMSGLGYVFSDAAAGRHLLRSLTSRLYRLAADRAEAIFVFNGDDHRALLENGIIEPRHRVIQVPGSGVDTDHFSFASLPPGPPVVLMVARLMRDKGVREYLEAAREIRKERPDIRFQLLGRVEHENPTGISEAQIAEWARLGLIEYLPETRDVRPCLRAAHLFVLPSYYREGLPRTILEALATGRPVITTDLPGCREPITQGENGWLVPPRDSAALAATIRSALADPDRLARMGAAARRIARSTYDVVKVNELLMGEMRLIQRAEESVRPERYSRAEQPLGAQG